MRLTIKKIFLIYLVLYFLILVTFLNTRDFFLDEGAHGMDSLFLYKFLKNPTIHIRKFVFRFYSYYPALFLNQYPPLIHGITSIFYLIFGASEFVSRLVISLISIATLVMIYLLGRKIFNEETGIIASLLLSVIPYFFTFSQLFMMEIPMILLFTLSAYLTYNKKNPILLAFVLTLNFYTKFPSVIFFGVIGLYVLWTRNLKRDFFYFIKVGIIFAILTIPFLIFLYLESGLVFGLKQLKAEEEFVDIIFWETDMNFIKNSKIINLLYFPYHMLYHIPIFILVLCIFGVSKLNDQKKLLITWIIFFIIIFTILPNKTPKYVIYVFPPIVILAAAGFQKFRFKQKNFFIVGFVLLSLILLILNPLNLDADIKENYKRIGSKYLSEYLEDNIQENGTVFVMNKESYNIIFSFAKNNNFENKMIRAIECKFENITEDEFKSFIRKNNVQFIIGSTNDPIYARLSNFLSDLPVVKEYGYLKVHENKNINLKRMPKVCNYNRFVNLEFCED